MENCDLDNGEKVGVAAQFIWPAPADVMTPEQKFYALQLIRGGQWMASSRNKQAWVGVPIAEALDLDMEDQDAVLTLKGIIKSWLKTSVLREVEGHDTGHRTRTYVEVCDAQL